MLRRLAPRLILSLTLIAAVIQAAFGLLSSRTQERQLLDAMILGADQLSRAITSATWHAMLADRRAAAYEVMQTIAQKQGIEGIRIFNKAGRIMFSTNAREVNRQVDKDAESCSLCHASHQPLVRVDVPSRARVFRGGDGRRKLAMVTPIYNEPACSQAACHAHPAGTQVLGVLDVLLNLDPVDVEVAGMRSRVLLVTAAHVLLIGAFIFFFTRRFLAVPIGKLIAATKSVSEMDLDQPIELHTSEDLEELARSFDAMRARLKLALAELGQFTQRLEAKVAERTEELKAAHQKLMQTNRLASLGQLAASVAHEINNPLSGVLNLSMLMQRILQDDGVPPARVEDFRKYLSQVAGETARAGRILSALLAFSRQSKPQRAEADLNRLVRGTLPLVAHKLQLMEVAVNLELDEALPPVFCDGPQIQQVLVNLLLNAAEATPAQAGGRIRVCTKAGAGGTVELAVADGGEGIPPESLPHLFEPFFTTKPEGKGVGLGLAVSYGIVQAHGGEIEVDSKPGEGTVFTVRLPVAAVAQLQST